MSRWEDVDAVARAKVMTMQKPRQNMAQVWFRVLGRFFFFLEGREACAAHLRRPVLHRGELWSKLLVNKVFVDLVFVVHECIKVPDFKLYVGHY